MTFVEQSLVFFGATIVLVPLFKKLGFGSVLGYLIAGIVVGPYVLGFIRDPETVFHFSELGVVLLLFMIGIEIHPHKLWAMRRHLIGLGGVQVIFCTLLFTLIGLFFDLSLAVAVIIGFGLSLSSTAFAVQTLTEKNQFNTEFGRASFSILLMQDLFAIPALALIPVFAVNETKEMSWSGAAAGLAVIVLIIIVGRFLMRPLFRAVASMRSRELFTATTLFIVLGVAALMQKVGLSAALGTFIAGVLLADSEYRHELETNLEPFKSILLGLFFIAVGMSVKLDLILQQPLLIILLTLGYLFVKAGVIYLAGRIFKLQHNNSKAMALMIAQGGEFAFVIFGIVSQLKMTPENTLSLLTVIITLSMALNPLLNFISEKISKFAQKEIAPRYDEIDDQEAMVIIAGFGRFGQIFSRIFRAQNISFVAIDHDPTQIELVRKFGSKVYYGDASRKDILEAAGAAKAKYFILAIDDVEASVQTAKLIKEDFPNLKIFARARNRGHAFDLMQLGIMNIKREVFDSSVYFARDLLLDMGFSKEKATTLIDKFKIHDEIMLEEQFKVRDDDKIFVSVSSQASAQLAQVLSEDEKQSNISR